MKPHFRYNIKEAFLLINYFNYELQCDISH